jgi:23S rRNA (adenine2503-C2)-methyltransferase
MWNKIIKLESNDKNVMKFVFESDSAVAEAVLYKYPTYADRTVICCSTQSGCPMGCSFCGTGKQFIRNLTTEEIVDQVEECMQHVWESDMVTSRKIDKLQIMFMSMGEPMLNWKALKPAIVQLNDMYPEAALLISTSAPDVPKAFNELIELAVKIPQIGLQFSVHESLQEERDKLIPFKRKMSLKEIGIAGAVWFIHTKRSPYFNYCVHDNNNTFGDAARLFRLFDPSYWEATISVICEADESVSSSISRQEELATGFSRILLERGYNTRVFNPAGQDDIGGGCGQLWHTQQWMLDHPSKTRATNG